MTATVQSPQRGHRLIIRVKQVATGAVGTIALATLASRLVGFIRWLAQSAFVGSGPTAGAYASANQIPNIIFEITVGGALAGLTVPLLAGHLTRGRQETANRIASALFTWVTLILTAVALIVFLGAETIAHVLPVPTDTNVASQYALITTFLRIFAWQIPLYGVSIVLTGVLQARKKFLLPALAPLFASLVVIATFAGYGILNPVKDGIPPRTAVLVLGWGTTAGVAALSLPLLIPVYRYGIRLRPTLKLTAPERRKAISLGMAGLGALLAQQIAVIAGLWLMRVYGEGGTVAIFQYVQAVYWLPYAILAYPLATAAFPTLSEQGENGCDNRFCATCSWATIRVTMASLVGVALLITMAPVAEQFFSILTPVPGMSSALTVMAPALVGYSLLFYGQRVFYSVAQSKVAWRIALGAWLTVTVTAAILVPALASTGGDGIATLRGLAAAHAVGMSVGAVAVLVSIYYRVGAHAIDRLVPTVLRALPLLVVTATAGFISTSMLVRLNLHPLAVTALSGTAGMVILVVAIGYFGRRIVLGALTSAQPRFLANHDRGEDK
ncbi:MAG: lipid II flippase MurJ [Actinomycetaceae bacterium]|nr:lipid II flippase MurJ [Actinomycetaceae bacterium]